MRCYFSPVDLSPVGQVLGRQLDLLLYLLAMALFSQVILLVEVILLHLLLRMMTILLLLLLEILQRH
jgi:hypothetical protein